MKNILKKGFAVIFSAVIVMCLIPAQQVKADGFDLGTVKGNVYENSYFGYKVTLPAGYSFTTNELDHPETAMALVEAGAGMLILEAETTTGYSNANIILTNGASSYTEKEILTQGIAEIKASAGTNVKINSAEIQSQKIAGDKRSIIAVSATIGDITFSQKEVILINGDYGMIITFTGVDDAETTEMLKWITKL